MEGAPDAVDCQAMLAKIEGLHKVEAVHDFHCWSLSKGKYSMSAHIVCTDSPMEVLVEATKVVKSYGIENCTIQMEDKTAECDDDNKDAYKIKNDPPKKKENGHGHGHGHDDDHGHKH